MVRRRLTVKRLDPWSVLKFGLVANVVLLAVFLLVALVVWFIIDRLALVDQVCAIALDVGFTQCGVNFGNLFRALILLGLLWVVVQTAVLVFLSFLHNLIADLTGGVALTVLDTTPGAAARGEAATGATTRATPTSSRTSPPPVPPLRRDSRTPDDDEPASEPHRDPQRVAEERHHGGSDEVMFGDRSEGGR